MSITKRTVNFFTYDFFIHENGHDVILNPRDIFSQFLTNLSNPGSEKKMILPNNKFCLLDYHRDDENYVVGYFISAKTRHRPNLIDEESLIRRANPKTETEGEEEKTHFVLKFDLNTKQIICLLESRNVGITANAIKKYMKNFIRNEIQIQYKFIAREEFLEEFDNLSNVKVGDIFIDARTIGSDFLKFGELSDTLQEEIMVQTKAKRGQSIKKTLKKAIDQLISGTRSDIKRIRVQGRDNDNNPVVLNTDFAKKQLIIQAILDDETKIVNSEKLLNDMKDALRDY